MLRSDGKSPSPSNTEFTMAVFSLTFKIVCVKLPGLCSLALYAFTMWTMNTVCELSAIHNGQFWMMSIAPIASITTCLGKWLLPSVIDKFTLSSQTSLLKLQVEHHVGKSKIEFFHSILFFLHRKGWIISRFWMETLGSTMICRFPPTSRV